MRSDTRAAVLIGGAAWLCGSLALTLDATRTLLLLAPCVAVPLALELVPQCVAGGSLAWRVARLAQPWAAAVLVGSFAVARGPIAGAL